MQGILRLVEHADGTLVQSVNRAVYRRPTIPYFAAVPVVPMLDTGVGLQAFEGKEMEAVCGALLTGKLKENDPMILLDLEDIILNDSPL